MDIWRRILFLLGLRYGEGERVFELDEQLHKGLVRLAERENSDMEKLPGELIKSALENRYKNEELWQKWQALSFREQQVAALACRGYTNKQIGSRLSISSETVKTHVRNVLTRFNLRGKEELRQTLADWDFTDWN